MPKILREGGCLCGAIRYQIEGEPFDADYCHCLFVPKSTAFGAWMILRQAKLFDG